MIEKKLKDIYYNLNGGEGAYSGSAVILKNVYNEKNPENKITIKKAQFFLNKQDSYVLHRKKSINYKRNKVWVFEPDMQFCAAIVDLPSYREHNNGKKYILLIMEVFTKFLYAEPLERKDTDTSLEGLKKIMKRVKKYPLTMQVDAGGEFLNKKMKIYMKKLNIHMFTSDGLKKNSICERVIRTILTKIYRRFDTTYSKNWLDILPKIVQSYNNTFHRSIGMRPRDVTFRNHIEVYNKLYKKHTKITPKLKNDDLVKLNLNLGVFSKAYSQSWSRANYKIVSIKYPQGGYIPMYKIQQLASEKRVPGYFYPSELLKLNKDVFSETNFSFPIEAIYPSKKGNKYRAIKWLGYEDSENTDILLTDLQKIDKNLLVYEK